MIGIRWTEPANADFLDIVEWLRSKSPRAARNVGRKILASVEILQTHPYAGKSGRSPDTRELAVTRYPYLIVYSVDDSGAVADPSGVVILRVLHGAMLWPPKVR